MPYASRRFGTVAWARLRGGNRYPIVPPPRLVLLDLHMPGMDGFEILDELRADPVLRRTVVFEMTTSTAAKERQRRGDGRCVDISRGAGEV